MTTECLSGFLCPSHIIAALDATTKTEVLLKISGFASHIVPGLDDQDIFSTLQEREELGSTGIGGGIAIPHGRFQKLSKPVLVLGKSLHPVEFDAIDELPVDLFFAVLASTHSGDHLQLLAKLSRLFQDPDFAGRLRYCVTAEDIHRCIRHRESEIPC